MGDVLHLQPKYLRGGALSEEEITVARRALLADVPLHRLVACEALLRAGAPSDQALAVPVLESICRDALSSEGRIDPRLVFSMHLIPPRLVQQSTWMKRLAYRAAGDSSWGCRANAMLALRGLASVGDETALSLLRDALGDTDERVRQNADNSLMMLSKGSE